ncbi:FkbM family methyltransferase [Alphaproteobacteria bacterium]|nr:FkbM family methyltransferase [Alphaproteobacteria bacterium]
MSPKKTSRAMILLVFLSVVLGGLAYNKRADIKTYIIYSPTLSKLVMFVRDGEKIDENHLVATLDNGLKIIVNVNDPGVSRNIRIMGRWDANETALLDSLVTPGQTVVEVGANFGVNTLRMAHLTGEQGKVHAFEANPKVAQRLSRSLQMNQLQKNTAVHAMAAGDKNEKLFLTTEDLGAAHISQNNAGAIPVEVRPLDEVLPDLKIDLLKIDAEGYEYRIIKGAQDILNRSPHAILMIEWYPGMIQQQGNDPREFLTFLENMGYKNIWRVGPHTDRKGHLIPISHDELMTIRHCDLVLSRSPQKPLS